ncbi:Uncharacterised protein [Shigella flexneri]|nr:Uncharacterised protein [Shigella flexneri]
MGADHHLRTCRFIEADQHRSQTIKSHFFLQASRFFQQDLPHFLFRGGDRICLAQRF